MDRTDVDVGLQLKVKILLSGRRQNEVARLAQIRETRLSRLCCGWSQPTQEERAKLSDVLGLSESELFEDGDSRIPA